MDEVKGTFFLQISSFRGSIQFSNRFLSKKKEASLFHISVGSVQAVNDDPIFESHKENREKETISSFASKKRSLKGSSLFFFST